MQVNLGVSLSRWEDTDERKKGIYDYSLMQMQWCARYLLKLLRNCNKLSAKNFNILVIYREEKRM